MTKKWAGCWGGLSCFGAQKGGKRIVPAARTPDGTAGANQSNGPQPAGLSNPATSLAPSLLAPPSSPASFSNSALPSTAQSPSCMLSLSANSPGVPSTMFATGPYAHETQLVSPPVFSTFTTEPSTAPFTPPPELAHLTTPSSPDVPFAQFLSSSSDLKCTEKTTYISANDLQTTYPLSPGSPASSLISPKSRTSGDIPSYVPEKGYSKWDPDPSHAANTGSVHPASSQDSNFFCPATFAQFYLDQAVPHSGGRLSISRESDVYPSGGNVHNVKRNRNKPEVEEIEAYRASFGFSADEMISTPQYVEISDVMDDSFTMQPCTSDKQHTEETMPSGWGLAGQRAKSECNSPSLKCTELVTNSCDEGMHQRGTVRSNLIEDEKVAGQSASCNDSDEVDIFFDARAPRNKRRYHIGSSCSDAEIDYRRGRSLRESRGH